MPRERKWECTIDNLQYGSLEVLHSAAGYYIGRLCKVEDEVGPVESGTRESGYFATEKEAQEALKTGDWEVRYCMENEFAYSNGLPRPKTNPKH